MLSHGDAKTIVDAIEEGSTITVKFVQFGKDVTLSGTFTRAEGVDSVVSDKGIRPIFDSHLEHTVFLSIASRRGRAKTPTVTDDAGAADHEVALPAQPPRSQPPPRPPVTDPATQGGLRAVVQPLAAPVAAAAPNAAVEALRLELALEQAKNANLQLQVELARMAANARPVAPAMNLHNDLLVAALSSDNLRDSVSGDNRPRRYLTLGNGSEGDRRVCVKEGGTYSQLLDATKRIDTPELDGWRTNVMHYGTRMANRYKNHTMELDIERKLDQIVHQLRRMQELKQEGNPLANKEDWSLLVSLNRELVGFFARVRGTLANAARVTAVLDDQWVNGTIDYDGAWKLVFRESA